MTPSLDPSLRRRFGKTDLLVSPLGFGGAPLGFLETEAQTASRVLNGLLDSGVNLVDTAAMYDASEAMIGRTLSGRRDDFVLVTKCGLARKGGDPKRWTRQHIQNDIENSLRALRTDVLDVVLLHTPSLEIFERAEALGAIVEARDAGKVRFAGLSGDNATALAAANHPDVSVIQTSINFVDQANLEQTLPAAVSQDVGVMVKRPLANAAWKPPAEQYELYLRYYTPYRERFEALGFALDDFGGEVESWPELALRFVLSQPGVSVAIVGTTNPKHVGANVAAAASGPLSETAVQWIRERFEKARGDQDWPGLT